MPFILSKRVAIVAALALMPPLTVQAQITPGTGAGTRTFEAPPITRAPSRLDIAIPDASVMLQKLAGRVTRFRVSGATVVSGAELAAVLLPWTGRDLSAADLSAALNAVRTCLRQRGLYTADAFFPEQTTADGEVQIAVLEGRLGTLTLDMNPDARLRRTTAEKHLARLQPDSLIQRGGFDTSLLLLNDLPGVQVTPSLTPADTQGRADLRVRIDDETVASGYVQLDNHELRELGEYRYTGALRLRNPLGIGDLATAQFTQTHTSGRMLGAVSYSLPLGGWGTRVGARIATHQYRLGGDFEALLAKGRYTSAQVKLSHPFVRTNDGNITAEIQFDETRYHDSIDSVSAVNDFRYRLGSLTLHADKSDNFLRGGSTVFYAQFRTGHVFLDTPGASAADATGLNIGGRFERSRLRLAREQSLTDRLSASLSVLAQHASNNLDGGLKLQLGGPEGVRAYGLAERFTDEGYLARLDVQYALPAIGDVRSRAGVFADTARGRVNKNPLPGADNTQGLTGYGLSLAATWRDKLSAELIVAWPTSAPVTDTSRHTRAWATARYLF